MITSIRSDNNTLHIPLYNHNNAYCFHVSVLQRLHSSPSLNRLLRDTANDQQNDIVDILLYPAEVYASLDNGNTDYVYEEIRNYFPSFESQFVHDESKDGYFPETLLVFTYLPCIWKRCDRNRDLFTQIVNELNIDRINIYDTEVSIDDAYSRDSYLRLEYSAILRDLYTDMLENIKGITFDGKWVCGTFEIFPNKDHNGGHAVTLISSGGTFYVIDDQKYITPLNEYYKLREERIYSITIRDIDAVTLARINAILQTNQILESKFASRVSRYEFNLSNKFTSISDNDILKTAITQTFNGGGAEQSFVAGITLSIVIRALVIILLVALITACVVYVAKNRDTLKRLMVNSAR